MKKIAMLAVAAGMFATPAMAYDWSDQSTAGNYTYDAGSATTGAASATQIRTTLTSVYDLLGGNYNETTQRADTSGSDWATDADNLDTALAAVRDPGNIPTLTLGSGGLLAPLPASGLTGDEINNVRAAADALLQGVIQDLTGRSTANGAVQTVTINDASNDSGGYIGEWLKVLVADANDTGVAIGNATTYKEAVTLYNDFVERYNEEVPYFNNAVEEATNSLSLVNNVTSGVQNYANGLTAGQ